MHIIIATLATAYLSIASVKADVTKPTGLYPVRNAEVVRMAKPQFPELAEKARMDGYVLVRVQVGVDGKAVNAMIAKSTNPMFEKAALQSAMTARYSPATMPHGPVTSWLEIPFTFTYRR